METAKGSWKICGGIRTLGLARVCERRTGNSKIENLRHAAGRRHEFGRARIHHQHAPVTVVDLTKHLFLESTIIPLSKITKCRGNYHDATRAGGRRGGKLLYK